MNLIMQFSPEPCYFIRVWSKIIFSAPCSLIPSICVHHVMWETKFHTHTKQLVKYCFEWYTKCLWCKCSIYLLLKSWCLYLIHQQVWYFSHIIFPIYTFQFLMPIRILLKRFHCIQVWFLISCSMYKVHVLLLKLIHNVSINKYMVTTALLAR
jgi:hypothetical protein